VGDNYEDLILNNEQDALIYIYHPKSKTLKENDRTFSEVANRLSNNSNLIVAFVDGSTNDVIKY